MINKQREAILELCSKRITKNEFYKAYGISEATIVNEVGIQLKRALLEKNPDNVEYSLLLGFSFEFPEGLIESLNELSICSWHISHEDVLRLLQKKRSVSSIEYLSKAIRLKGELEYLEHDDYGAYYAKCLWALVAIGTIEAKNEVQVHTLSNIQPLRNEAVICLSKFGKCSQ